MLAWVVAFCFSVIGVVIVWGADPVAAGRESSQLATWKLTIVLQLGIWGGALVKFVEWCAVELHPNVPRPTRALGRWKAWWGYMVQVVALAVAAMLAGVLAFEVLDDVDDLYFELLNVAPNVQGMNHRFLAILIVNICMVTPGVVGLRAVILAASTGEQRGDRFDRWSSVDGAGLVAAFERLTVLRHRVRWILVVFGVLLTAYLASFALLIAANNDLAGCCGAIVSLDRVIFFGILLGLILAILYIPVFVRLETAAHDLVSRMAEVEAARRGASFIEQLEVRKAVREELGLGNSTRAALEGAIVVFAPLATAFLTSNLG